MDLDSLQADLNALRRLYGLLLINGSDERSAVSETLDEESRVLLRKLLDDAAERVFEAHIKMLADDWTSLVAAPCLAQLEEAENAASLQSSVPSYGAKSPSCNENIKEDLKCLTSLHKDEMSSKSRMLNNAPSFASTLQRSATDLQRRKKRCLVCQQSSKLEMMSIGNAPEKKSESVNCALSIPDQGLEAKQPLEPVKNPDMQGNKRASETFHESGDIELLASSGSNMRASTEVEEKPSNVEDFSKEVDDAIKRIESLIPSLYRLAKPPRAPREKKVSSPDIFRMRNSVTDLDAVGASGRIDGVVARSARSQTSQSEQPNQRIENCDKPAPTLFHDQDEMVKGNRLLEGSVPRIQGDFGSAKGKQIARTSELSGANANTILETMERLHGNVSQNDSATSQIPEHIQRIKILPSQFYEYDDYQDQRRRRVRRKILNSRSPALAPSISSTSFVSPRRRVGTRNSVHRANQVQPRRSVFGKNIRSSRKSTGYQENSYWPSRSNGLHSFDESDETRSDASASSSWATVEASSYSSPDDTIETAISYNSENEDTGSSGWNYKDVNDESSEIECATSESVKYGASSNNSLDYEGDASTSEYYQTDHHAVRRRGGGGFRRLKNKLGLIFHHHHHHHHHHRNNNVARAHGSLWKGLGKMFRHKHHKVERKGKHLARSGSRKQQIGHFHALVEGLLRHVRHSSKSRQNKGGVRKLGGRRLGENKAANHLHWWQNLGAQRGRMQVPNKARINLRHRNKKPQLTAAKKLLRHS